MNKKISALICLIAAGAATNADAWQFTRGPATFRITGYGTAGIIEPDFDKPDFLGDWRVRAQAAHSAGRDKSVGLVYALDAQTVDNDDYIDDLFMIYEDKRYGRMEAGLTESIAGKLGLGLPDVGGLRMNDNPLFYKKISPHGPVIADTTLDTGDKALRVNLVSGPGTVQYGLSAAGITDDYKFALDAGLKMRRAAGKLKAAMSLGASLMDAPDNYNAAPYAPNVSADWRAQATAGVNLQYNSWVWGATARLIYDRNPSGPSSDGIAAGTGVSYDLLKYSVSVSYVFSDTGVWHDDNDNYADHTVVASFRYKYNENISGWMSAGMTTETPFFAAGMRLNF